MKRSRRVAVTLGAAGGMLAAMGVLSGPAQAGCTGTFAGAVQSNPSRIIDLTLLPPAVDTAPTFVYAGNDVNATTAYVNCVAVNGVS